jgi:hypothetical protein
VHVGLTKTVDVLVASAAGGSAGLDGRSGGGWDDHNRCGWLGCLM